MDLETRKDSGVTFLKILDQSLDSTISTNFKGRVIDLMNQGEKNFILNLSKVEFIDSSGLGAIISILKTLSFNNGNIIICEAQNSVINLLALTRMNRIFELYPNEKEALDSYKKRLIDV